jgi:predicted dehydrogenase
MRIGVAGAGALGFHHVRILRELAGDAFAGFHEPDVERAAKVASELGVTAHPTLDALLAASDAISIAAPTQAHHAVAMAAAARGKHLFIEKPITATVEDADAVLALAASKGLVVGVGHGERVNRAVRAAWPLLDRPRFISCTRYAPFTARGADVSVVRDLMVHDLDLVLAMMGEPVARVEATGASVISPTLDLAHAHLAFPSGASASVSTARVAGVRERLMRIVQANGLIALDLATGTGTFHRLRHDVDRAALAASKTPLDPSAFSEAIALSAPEGEPLRLEFAAWLAALRGEGQVLVSGRQGRDVLALALEIEAVIARGAHPGA